MIHAKIVDVDVLNITAMAGEIDDQPTGIFIKTRSFGYRLHGLIIFEPNNHSANFHWRAFRAHLQLLESAIMASGVADRNFVAVISEIYNLFAYQLPTTADSTVLPTIALTLGSTVLPAVILPVRGAITIAAGAGAINKQGSSTVSLVVVDAEIIEIDRVDIPAMAWKVND